MKKKAACVNPPSVRGRSNDLPRILLLNFEIPPQKTKIFMGIPLFTRRKELVKIKTGK